MAQMPEEGRKFGIVDRYWRDIMGEAIKDHHALEVTAQPNMLDRLKESNGLLEEIQKGLNDYLEKKRLYFPRCVIDTSLLPSFLAPSLDCSIPSPLFPSLVLHLPPHFSLSYLHLFSSISPSLPFSLPPFPSSPSIPYLSLPSPPWIPPSLPPSLHLTTSIISYVPQILFPIQR